MQCAQAAIEAAVAVDTGIAITMGLMPIGRIPVNDETGNAKDATEYA